MRLVRLIGILAAMMVFAALAACASTTGAPGPASGGGAGLAPGGPAGGVGQRGVDPASVLDSGQRLVVTVDDVQYGLKNGGTVRLGHGLTADLYLDPYPPTTLSSTLDVLLRQDGRSVEDGSVSVAYDMLAMDHGPFNATAKGIGGGHFVIALRYFMFGSWEQTLAIRAGAERLELPLVVIAHP